MENMEQQQWDFLDIKQFRSTQADARQPVFPVMWFILMCRQQGAYRGYGATQGIFALESAVNELAEKLKIDPVELRMKNIVRGGHVHAGLFWRDGECLCT